MVNKGESRVSDGTLLFLLHKSGKSDYLDTWFRIMQSQG